MDSMEMHSIQKSSIGRRGSESYWHSSQLNFINTLGKPSDVRIRISLFLQLLPWLITNVKFKFNRMFPNADHFREILFNLISWVYFKTFLSFPFLTRCNFLWQFNVNDTTEKKLPVIILLNMYIFGIIYMYNRFTINLPAQNQKKFKHKLNSMTIIWEKSSLQNIHVTK